jgi:hypothetical protein
MTETLLTLAKLKRHADRMTKLERRPSDACREVAEASRRVDLDALDDTRHPPPRRFYRDDNLFFPVLLLTRIYDGICRRGSSQEQAIDDALDLQWARPRPSSSDQEELDI